MQSKFAIFVSVVALVLSSAAMATTSSSSGSSGSSSGGGHSGGGGGGSSGGHSGGAGGGHGGFSGAGVSAHAFGGHAGGYAVAGVYGHGMDHAAAAAVAAQDGTLHSSVANAVALHGAADKVASHNPNAARLAVATRPPRGPRPGQPHQHSRSTQPGAFTGVAYDTHAWVPCALGLHSVVGGGVISPCAEPQKAPVDPNTGLPIG